MFSGAAALGLIAARFFKSSEGGHREREHRAAEQERPTSEPSRPAIDVSSGEKEQTAGPKG